MTQLGLQVVSNPSELFLSEQNSDSEILAGLAVAVIMDGSRSFLLEIQVVILFFFPIIQMVIANWMSRMKLFSNPYRNGIMLKITWALQSD